MTQPFHAVLLSFAINCSIQYLDSRLNNTNLTVCLLAPFYIQQIPCYQVVFQALTGPLSELHTAAGLHAVSNGCNHDPIEKFPCICLGSSFDGKVLRSICKICTYQFFGQLHFLKYVACVSTNSRSIPIK